MDLPDPVNRRARHVVTEDQRVLDAVDAMKSGDLEGLDGAVGGGIVELDLHEHVDVGAAGVEDRDRLGRVDIGRCAHGEHPDRGRSGGSEGGGETLRPTIAPDQRLDLLGCEHRRRLLKRIRVVREGEV